MCGDFKVDTPEYRVEDVPLYKSLNNIKVQGFLAKLLGRS